MFSKQFCLNKQRDLKIKFFPSKD